MELVPAVKKNFTLPSSVANRIDELADRYINMKGHGQVVTAAIIAFEMLNETKQREMMLAARKIEMEDRFGMTTADKINDRKAASTRARPRGKSSTDDE